MGIKPNNVKFLLYSHQKNVATIIRTALTAFKFSHFKTSDSIESVASDVMYIPFDIMIVNIDKNTELDLITRIAHDEEFSANPFCIIIGCTADPTASFCKQALKLGLDGVVRMPFSAECLWRVLASNVNHTRSFVRTKTYFGPDRRRKGEFAYDGEEKRKLNVSFSANRTGASSTFQGAMI